MVRFVDNNTVLINEPTNENHEIEKKQLRSILKDARLDIIEIPYMPTCDPTFASAKGSPQLPSNETSHNRPILNQSTDDKAIRLLENIFEGQKIVAMDCNEISAESGVLNCISCNIFE